jgi:2-polyprenyl-6-methoxyphenol hydroxylase-like FAD-dependent oxidoreductase
MTSLKVLIAGAGIGGPAAAFWLSRVGCHVTVVERSPSLRATGQQVDLSGQGIVVTRMMGIEDQLRAARCPEPGMRLVDSQGVTKAFFPVDDSGEAVFSPTHEVEVMRGDLVRMLYEATENLRGVNYVFDRHITEFTQDPPSPGGKVNVTLSDGTQDRYDILIGADGIASATRKHLLGTSFSEMHRDLGVYMAYFTAPSRENDTFDWNVCHIPGGKAIMTRRDKPENIRVYLTTRVGFDALDAAKTLKEQKTALVDLFKGTQGWQLDRFLNDLQNSPEADDLYCQRMSQIRLPEGAWSKGRVILLGDAAYCPGAIGGGIGTTAALIGAYVLAGEIDKQWRKSGQSPDKFNAEEAGKEYERIVRPFITSKSDMPTWMVRLWLPESNFGVKTIQTIAGFAAGSQLSKYMGNRKKPDESQKLEYPDYFGMGPKS